MTSHGHRSTPSRTKLQRRSTRGPLDADDDPLAGEVSSQQHSMISTPLANSQDLSATPSKSDAEQRWLEDEDTEPTSVKVDNSLKDLTFLLDGSHFHPLSQVDIPPPFRRPFPGPPPPGASPEQLFEILYKLIGNGDFLAAAHSSVLCLTSGFVKPTDSSSIFKLLAIRYSCLEIMGQTLLAAQEAKALEDLSSDFYFSLHKDSESSGTKIHIMPFSLRVQAIRLQTIGFSDPRRGITMLYDLGFELRQQLATPISEEERRNLTSQLASLPLHVVNSLVEAGDLECAYRTLEQTIVKQQGSPDQEVRVLVLLLRMGRMREARTVLDNQPVRKPQTLLCKALVAMAEGDLDQAVSELDRAASAKTSSEYTPVIKQNLAVALLYVGRIQEAQAIFNQLVEEGQTFPSLMINLATVFELTSEKAKDQKNELITKIANRQRTIPLTNSDFKL